MITPDPLEALKEAFQSDDGFLVELRCFARWNKAAFARLVAAMQFYLETAEPGEHVERWIAEGFWMHDAMVRDLSCTITRSVAEQVYHDAACQRLAELAGWFFTGQPPWRGNLPPFAA